MNSPLPSLRVQRPAKAGREVTSQTPGVRVEFPKSDIQSAERLNKSDGGGSRCGRKNKNGPVREEAILGGLHQTFAPVLQFCLDCGELETFQSDRGKVFRTWRGVPRHKEHVCPTKPVQSEFTACGESPLCGQFLQLGLQISLFKFCDEVRFPALRRTGDREIAPSVVTPEFHGFGTGSRVCHISGSGAWDGRDFL